MEGPGRALLLTGAPTNILDVFELLTVHGIEVRKDNRSIGVTSGVIPANTIMRAMSGVLQGAVAVVEARDMCLDIDCEKCRRRLAKLNTDLQTQHVDEENRQQQKEQAGGAMASTVGASTSVRSKPVIVSFDERQLLPRWWEKQAYVPNPIRYPHIDSSWDGRRHALVGWAGPTKALDEHVDDIFYDGAITAEVFDYYREQNRGVAHLTAQALKNFGSSFNEDSLLQLEELHRASPPPSSAPAGVSPRKGALCWVCPLPADDAAYW
jgi:hypothetical protein